MNDTCGCSEYLLPITASRAARVWRPSTFCVAMTTSSRRKANSAIALWASLGRDLAAARRRSSYHSQTRHASRWKASRVARSSGRCFFQCHSEPRNVVRPESTLNPAPVSTMTPSESRKMSRPRSISLKVAAAAPDQPVSLLNCCSTQSTALSRSVTSKVGEEQLSVTFSDKRFTQIVLIPMYTAGCMSWK